MAIRFPPGVKQVAPSKEHAPAPSAPQQLDQPLARPPSFPPAQPPQMVEIDADSDADDQPDTCSSASVAHDDASDFSLAADPESPDSKQAGWGLWSAVSAVSSATTGADAKDWVAWGGQKAAAVAQTAAVVVNATKEVAEAVAEDQRSRFRQDFANLSAVVEACEAQAPDLEHVGLVYKLSREAEVVEIASLMGHCCGTSFDAAEALIGRAVSSEGRGLVMAKLDQILGYSSFCVHTGAIEALVADPGVGGMLVRAVLEKCPTGLHCFVDLARPSVVDLLLQHGLQAADTLTVLECVPQQLAPESSAAAVTELSELAALFCAAGASEWAREATVAAAQEECSGDVCGWVVRQGGEVVGVGLLWPDGMLEAVGQVEAVVHAAVAACGDTRVVTVAVSMFKQPALLKRLLGMFRVRKVVQHLVLTCDEQQRTDHSARLPRFTTV